MMNVMLLLFAMAGDPANCSMHAQHTAAQHTDVDRRGDAVMGFSHEKTKHSFRLLDDGGAIEVRANDAADAENIAAIRSHLRDIAKEFAAGEFTKPEEIHARVPDGVDVMKERGAAIAFEYEELDRGARVHLETSDAQAREAIHAFLRFQINDHRTGDSLEVE
jgi:TusA-related sulfurtransferase